VNDRYIVLWWALLVGALCFLPLPLAAHIELRSVWPFALASACFQLLYYVILSFAYNRGDFSLIYPIARGAAPIFIALGSMLFLHESVSWAGAGGLIVIVLGVMSIGGSAWRGGVKQAGQFSPATLAPFLVALCIAGYSVVDGAAVRHASPLPYTALGFLINVLFLTPLMLVRHSWAKMVGVWRRHWRRIGLIGLCNFAAYGLALTAYALAPVAYVGAVREVSIVFAALAGWLWLGEPFGLVRTLGALVVCSGILIVTLAG
jgi:drug/metabolite transporter (DMT)-like permease